MNIAPRIIGRLPAQLLATAAGLRRRHRLIERLSACVVSGLRNRDVVIRVGAAKGLVLNTGEYNLNYLLPFAEPDVSAALKTVLAAGMTFYDIGANVGFYTILGARIVGAGGTVASFEPLQHNRELVEHNVRANGFSNVQCLPYAVGEYDGVEKFMLSEGHSWGMLAGQGHTPMKFAGEIVVGVRNLSGLVNSGDLKPPHVIKMDVEGGEAAVLRGAIEVIATYRPILFIELHDTTTAVLSELERQGYHTSLFGSTMPVKAVEGNLHIAAVPSEQADRDFLLSRLQSSSFPRCGRCAHI